MELYGIWFEKTGWWAEVGHKIFVTQHQRVALAQLRLLMLRGIGQKPGANEENPPNIDWYDKPRLAYMARDGTPIIIHGPSREA